MKGLDYEKVRLILCTAASVLLLFFTFFIGLWLGGNLYRHRGGNEGVVLPFEQCEEVLRETEAGIGAAEETAGTVRENIAAGRDLLRHAYGTAESIGNHAEEGERSIAECENILRSIQERGRKETSPSEEGEKY